MDPMWSYDDQVYDEEYYNQPPIDFKVEHNPNESNVELR
jgi:hypothetical protein